MKLRSKTTLNLLLVAALMVAGIFAASYSVMLNSFRQVETDDIFRDVGQAKDVLAEREGALRTRVADWAFWDDTYQFVTDGNPEFIESNLTDDLFESFFKNINYVFVIDREGKTVFAKGYDYELSKEVALPTGLAEHLQLSDPLLNLPTLESYASGYVMTGEGPVLIASYPILTSKMEGPARGAVVFGILISDSYIEELSNTLKASIRVERSDMPATMSSDFSIAAKHLTSENPIIQGFIEGNETHTERVAGYTMVSDLYGKPAFVLRVDKARTIFERGRTALTYFVILLAGSGAVMVLVALLLLERTVLSRLTLLSSEVKHIHSEQDLARRVTVTGQDEIAELGANVNRMLSAIEHATHAVQVNEARLTAVVDTAVDGIITTDTKGNILTFNKAAESIFGAQALEVVGMNISELMPEPYRSQHAEYLREYLETRDPKLVGTGRELLGQRKDGTVFPIYLAISEVRKGDTHIFTGIVRDITERKKLEEILTQAATFDALTGLMTRRAFQEQLDVAMHSAKRYGHAMSLCVCDVDYFKQVNDTYGHKVGDMVLAKMGELIRERLRHDDVAGRFGGDEFCICFSHKPGIETVQALERIRKALGEIEFAAGDGRTFHVNATFGVADLSHVNMDDKALFEAADKALYEAKEAGRNRCAVYGMGVYMPLPAAKPNAAPTQAKPEMGISHEA